MTTENVEWFSVVLPYNTQKSMFSYFFLHICKIWEIWSKSVILFLCVSYQSFFTSHCIRVQNAEIAQKSALFAIFGQKALYAVFIHLLWLALMFLAIFSKTT